MRLRIAGIVLSVLLGGAAVAVIVLDGEEEPFGRGDSLLPSFSAGYQCTDPRDELAAEELSYVLGYSREQWSARVALSVAGGETRGPCSVQLGVPTGSEDLESEDANVLLERHGSPSSGIASVPLRDRARDYVMNVTLPRDFELFHALGFGKYVFELDFFAPGEGESFKQATVDLRLPEGYSIDEALPPGDNPGSERSRKWTFKADRDQQAVVTFEHDRLRTAVDLAPEVAFGALLLV
ncbi:MAG TPA: hypothetical protein VEV43_05505 [Actinomycetota bacterium]|nr:hypothetical protein [Actinomycetota bacterium]